MDTEVEALLDGGLDEVVHVLNLIRSGRVVVTEVETLSYNTFVTCRAL